MRIFALTYFVRWVSFAAQSFFLAIGKSVQASILSVSVALVVPLLLIGAFYPLELTGLWLNTPVTAAVVGALAVVLFAAFMRNLRKKPPFGVAAAPAATAAAPAGDGQETAPRQRRTALGDIAEVYVKSLYGRPASARCRPSSTQIGQVTESVAGSSAFFRDFRQTSCYT